MLAAASALASCSGARVSLLRVVQPVPLLSAAAGVPLGYIAPTFVDDPATQSFAEAADRELAEVAARLRDEHGLVVETHVVVEAGVAGAILDFARTHDADVIAMSTHGRGVSRLLLGSVADKVLRGGGLPLLAYRPARTVRSAEMAEAWAEVGSATKASA